MHNERIIKSWFQLLEPFLRDTIMLTAEIIKECRAEAKKHGLSFVRHANKKNDEGSLVYCYTYRKSGEICRGNLTLGTSYEIACSGELANYNL